MRLKVSSVKDYKLNIDENRLKPNKEILKPTKRNLQKYKYDTVTLTINGNGKKKLKTSKDKRVHIIQQRKIKKNVEFTGDLNSTQKDTQAINYLFTKITIKGPEDIPDISVERIQHQKKNMRQKINIIFGLQLDQQYSQTGTTH